jgi:hydroxymethylglutaryl-CoA reductase (NADPH)
VLLSVEQGKTKLHALEKLLGDCERAVRVRRHFFGRQAARLGGPDAGAALDGVPYAGYDYGAVVGRNCEAVVGYIPIPVGVVGPLVIDGTSTMLPMATTEGCLVASTNRGCKAISSAGGAATVLTRDGMTRAPVIKLPSCGRAAQLCAWCEVPANVDALAAAFSSTTRFGKLQAVHGRIAGNLVRAHCVEIGSAAAHLERPPPHTALTHPSSPPARPDPTTPCTPAHTSCRFIYDSSAQRAMRWA